MASVFPVSHLNDVTAHAAQNVQHIHLHKANSAFRPSGVGKWVPASAGKAKADMVHSVSRWMRGVQVKLWDPLRTRAIPERLRGVFTTRRYTNTRLPLPYLTYTAGHFAVSCRMGNQTGCYLKQPRKKTTPQKKQKVHKHRPEPGPLGDKTVHPAHRNA